MRKGLDCLSVQVSSVCISVVRYKVFDAENEEEKSPISNGASMAICTKTKQQ